MLIRIVDDDADIRSSLEFLLTADGWDVVSYADAETFLAQDDLKKPGCNVLDIRMPGMSGLALQQELNRRGSTIPVIFLTGHGDIDMCVQAMKEGAKDFLIKPVNEEKLLTAISEAAREQSRPTMTPAQISGCWSKLTAREKEILPLLAKGLLNRAVAERLGLSIRTVEAHRQIGMKKLGVATIAELNAMLSAMNPPKQR